VATDADFGLEANLLRNAFKRQLWARRRSAIFGGTAWRIIERSHHVASAVGVEQRETPNRLQCLLLSPANSPDFLLCEEEELSFHFRYGDSRDPSYCVSSRASPSFPAIYPTVGFADEKTSLLPALASCRTKASLGCELSRRRSCALTVGVLSY